MSETTPCPCCGRDDLSLALRTQDQQDRIVAIFHCETCCALVPDYPRSHADTTAHQADFHADYWSDSTRETITDEATKMLHTVDFYGDYIQHFPPSTPILDLGGGRGLLTKALMDRGCNVRGCDPSLDLVQIAHSFLGLSVQNYTNEDILGFVDRHEESLGQRSGVIFLWHVIEHLEQPIKALRALSKLLRPDGLIIAQGPLLDKRYIFPEHRFFHCESNIAWIAQELGMKLLFLDSYSEERFTSFVLSNPEYPKEGLNLICTSNIHDAMGSLFSTLSTALHLSKTE